MDHFCYLFRACHAFFICSLQPGKGLTFWLSCVWYFLCFCHFPNGVLDQVWYLIVSIPDLCRLTYMCHDKILLKPWISRVLTTDDSQQTLSDFEYNMLNEPKLLTRVVDFMVSEGFFLSIFMSLWEQITQSCGGGQFEPRVIDSKVSVGFTLWTTMHCYILNIKAIGFMVSEVF